jgi:hypothetical protein
MITHGLSKVKPEEEAMQNTDKKLLDHACTATRGSVKVSVMPSVSNTIPPRPGVGVASLPSLCSAGSKNQVLRVTRVKTPHLTRLETILLAGAFGADFVYTVNIDGKNHLQ